MRGLEKNFNSQLNNQVMDNETSVQPHNANFKYPKQDEAQLPTPSRNRLVRFLAHFFSYLFHPLFITSYVIYFLIFIHPYAFAGFEQKAKVFRFLTVFLADAILPLFSVFLAWRLRLGVESIHLRTQKERIIPYAMAMIFYWWSWHVYANLPDMPSASIHFLLGSFLSVCAAWFCNIYFKISMHAVAMGGLVMFLVLFSFGDGFTSGLYLPGAILIAGVVCTARLALGAHTFFELYCGFFTGMLMQFIAWQF
ncbi:MAG TPA: hypothetical protein VNV85_17385 [Puia sp.]|nr:hypothetical protein [Puia sp.]